MQNDHNIAVGKKICVHTGNILDLNEVKKKAGQNPSEELIESLKITLSKCVPADLASSKDGVQQIYRTEDIQSLKLNSVERKDLKVSVKVFNSQLKKEALEEALSGVFSELGTPFVESLVLAYPDETSPSLLLPCLKELWGVLEEYVRVQKVLSIGVSDLDTEVFIALHSWAKVKPSIIQINLATCCVVPPPLQEFCKENEVQLLTHSDPIEILPQSALCEVFGSVQAQNSSSIELQWIARYQVHVKCRGVLSSKGYIVCAEKTY